MAETESSTNAEPNNSIVRRQNSKLPFFRQTFVTVAIFINTVGQGCAVGYAGIIIPEIKADPKSTITMTTEAAAWLASILAISMLFGNFLTGPIMANLGRKTGMYATSGVGILAVTICLFAINIEMLMIGRFLQGMSFGMAYPLRAVMLGEYTSPKYRGTFLSTTSLGQSVGILVVHCAGIITTWRLTALLIMSFFITNSSFMFFCPESPSFLATKGRYAESRKAFTWLRGETENAELEDMINSCMLINRINKELKERKRPLKVRIRDFSKIVNRKEFYKPILLISHCLTFAQFCGASVMANFPQEVLKIILQSTSNAGLWVGLLDLERLFANILIVFLVSKLKRRFIFIFSGLTIIACHFVIATFVLIRHEQVVNINWMPLVVAFVQMAMIGFGAVPIVNILVGEVFALEYRSLGASISVSVLALTAFVSLQTFPLALEKLGLSLTYFMIMIVLVYCFCVIYLVLPETKDKTLQQIEEEFRGGPIPVEEIVTRISREEEDPVYRRKMSERRNSVYV